MSANQTTTQQTVRIRYHYAGVKIPTCPQCGGDTKQYTSDYLRQTGYIRVHCPWCDRSSLEPLKQNQ